MDAADNTAASCQITHLRITECDHVAQSFWDLGEVVHEVPARDLFERLPETPSESHEGSCYIVDAINEAGEIVTDKEVTEELAQTLLDEPIPVLRQRFRDMLRDVFGVAG